jgi:hypothetical protein
MPTKVSTRSLFPRLFETSSVYPKLPSSDTESRRTRRTSLLKYSKLKEKKKDKSRSRSRSRNHIRSRKTTSSFSMFSTIICLLLIMILLMTQTPIPLYFISSTISLPFLSTVFKSSQFTLNDLKVHTPIDLNETQQWKMIEPTLLSSNIEIDTFTTPNCNKEFCKNNEITA